MTTQSEQFDIKQPQYKYVVIISIISATLFLLHFDVRAFSDWPVVIALVISASLLNYFSFLLPPKGNSFSLDSAVYLATLFTFGVEKALVILVLCSILALIYEYHVKLWKQVFNFSIYNLMFLGTYYCFQILGGSIGSITLANVIAYSTALSFYYILNVLLLGVYLYLVFYENLLKIFKGLSSALLASYISTLLLAVALSILIDAYPIFGIALFTSISILITVAFKHHFKLYEKANKYRLDDLFGQSDSREDIEKQLALTLISENMTDLITVTDHNRVIKYASPSHERILNIQPEFMEEKRFLDYLHPADTQRVEKVFTTVLQKKEPLQVEARYRTNEGSYLVVEISFKPVIEESGDIQYVVAVTHDISERKKTEEYLRTSEKLSVIGELAAGVAHEIRNPLTSIKGFIQLLKQPGQNERYYDIMLNELERINIIASELLVLAKPQAVHYKKKNITEILLTVIELLESQAHMKNIEITTDFDKDLPSVRCEENQLKQVYINIIKNAIESMSDGGQIHISAKLKPDGQILISCIDEGCGIPPELLSQLGKPFFTTKEKGTGLGLMVSQKIIKDHSGTIDIKSELNIGTTIQITLPAS